MIRFHFKDKSLQTLRKYLFYEFYLENEKPSEFNSTIRHAVLDIATGFVDEDRKYSNSYEKISRDPLYCMGIIQPSKWGTSEDIKPFWLSELPRHKQKPHYQLKRDACPNLSMITVNFVNKNIETLATYLWSLQYLYYQDSNFDQHGRYEIDNIIRYAILEIESGSIKVPPREVETLKSLNVVVKDDLILEPEKDSIKPEGLYFKNSSPENCNLWVQSITEIMMQTPDLYVTERIHINDLYTVFHHGFIDLMNYRENIRDQIRSIPCWNAINDDMIGVLGIFSNQQKKQVGFLGGIGFSYDGPPLAENASIVYIMDTQNTKIKYEAWPKFEPLHFSDLQLINNGQYYKRNFRRKI